MNADADTGVLEYDEKASLGKGDDTDIVKDAKQPEGDASSGVGESESHEVDEHDAERCNVGYEHFQGGDTSVNALDAANNDEIKSVASSCGSVTAVDTDDESNDDAVDDDDIIVASVIASDEIEKCASVSSINALEEDKE
ncbi:hypothetical protein PInf_002520 [Phytophthora infestans]|nr:hypothetical protein PInf_002520 [Phytophthora infestans]